MDGIAIFDLLRRRIYLIAAVCVVTMLGGYGLSFVSAVIPERYDASALVLVRPHDPIKIEEGSSSKEFLDFPVAQTPVVETASKTYIQIIQSPALIGGVVRELGLDHKPQEKEAAGDTILERMYRSMKALSNGVEPYISDAFSLVKYGRVVKEDPFTKAVNHVRRGLGLKSYEDTYVFEIDYADEDPRTAAEVANTTTRLFIKFMEDMRSSEGRDAANRLKSELEENRQQLVNARDNLEKYKASHGTFLYQPEYEAKLKVVSDLTVELAKLDASYANENLAAGTIEANTYAKKRGRLLKVLDENQADLGSLPSVERDLQLRQADVDVANSTYAIVAKKLQDAEIKSDAIPEARLISPAIAPQLPTSPRRVTIVLVSLFTGLLAGVALVFFLEYINRTARGIRDIEDFVGLKVVGTIPPARRVTSARRELEHLQ
jgi:uncharacterized protein involved in exopolysaccharide biosynthesis